ncbi:hypothetical protein BKA70DRAFT_1315274, partial [Coprinopsis sp. MPI-PUGE-AT-0042]
MGRLALIAGSLCCCCMTDAGPLGDGSEFRKPPKADPREREIDDAFRRRDYDQDASGHFHTASDAPTTTSARTSIHKSPHP